VTAKDHNWKKHLLRTSIPLEYQAARALTQQGFSVSAYPYSRLDNGTEKEFSVDVRGVTSYGPPEIPHPPAALDVLVECKHRDRGATWLFLPQPNGKSCGLHEALQYVDLFSPLFVHDVWWFDETYQTKFCYAGAEIGVSADSEEKKQSSERTRESQLKHGVRQLQYALPSIVTLRARWVAFHDLDENFPFFFVPILLTNASLIIAKPDFGVPAVEAAKSLEEIGEVVSYLIWAAALGPDFHTHAQRQIGNLSTLTKTSRMKAIEERRAAAGVPQWLQPSSVMGQIADDGAAAENIADFTKVIVTNVNAFPAVIRMVTLAFQRMVKSAKLQPLVKW
jgi:hypothetical protein